MYSYGVLFFVNRMAVCLGRGLSLFSDLNIFAAKAMTRQTAPAKISITAGISRTSASFAVSGRKIPRRMVVIVNRKPSSSSLLGTERTASTIRKVRHKKTTAEVHIASANSSDIASILKSPESPFSHC